MCLRSLVILYITVLNWHFCVRRVSSCTSSVLVFCTVRGPHVDLSGLQLIRPYGIDTKENTIQRVHGIPGSLPRI